MRALDIIVQFDPPISGCSNGVIAATMFTADLTSDQIEELIDKINETIKAFHLENGLFWED